ncbi:MAG TPA: hypothetical protein VF994_14490, partial [Myxococcales bacterium]
VLLSRTRRRRSGVYMLLLLLAMSGGCARGAGSASTSTDAGPPIRTTDETQYLSFGLPVNGLFELTGPGGGDPEQIHLLIDSSVRDLTAKIGVAGNGRSPDRLYTHVAASAAYEGAPALDFTNAPLWVAFNELSRPGFTTYPWERLRDGFDPIYQELAAHGSTHWGGTESAPFDGSGAVPAYEYLRRHFDFGATVVVLNTGATSAGLTDALTQAVFGRDALDAYARFLAGR